MISSMPARPWWRSAVARWRGRALAPGLLLLAAAALTLLAGRWASVVYAEWRWHEAIGALDVYRSALMHDAAWRIATAVVAFAFAFLNLYALRRSIVSLVLLGVFLVMSVIVIALNLLTDAIYRMIDPRVSVPIAKGTSPAPTAEPEPLEEPPGWKSVFHGLRTAGNGWSGVMLPLANSCVPSLPRITAPASFRRRTLSASIAGT